MSSDKIKICILEDHQSIIDGYLFRLQEEDQISIAGIAHYGEDLEKILSENSPDILILDIEVPISIKNPNSYPVLTVIPRIRARYPTLIILVISMHSQSVLIEKLFQMGVKGYIFKNDYGAITRLVDIIFALKSGGLYFGQGVVEKLRVSRSNNSKSKLLTSRQLEALSLCEAYPNYSTTELSERLGVTSSTFRNLLSQAYERLGVGTRTAAVAELQRLGIINSQDLTDQKKN